MAVVGPPAIPADPADSERWDITANALVAAAPPAIFAICNTHWMNGVDMVFRNGQPLAINDGLTVPCLTLQAPASYAALPASGGLNL